MNSPDTDSAVPKDTPAGPRSTQTSTSSIWSLVDNPWIVLFLLFFVMAILGLPVLWKSRGFSTLSKLVLSVVVTLYTALLFWLFWLILVWCYTEITRALT